MTVELPARGFVNVVQLVMGGFVSRLPIGFEAVDDLQIAVELILNSIAVDGGRATLNLVSDENGLTVSVGPFAKRSLEQHLQETTLEVGLRAFLLELADTIEITDGTAPAIVLQKKLEAQRV